ncbi:MAG: hypothetical protein ACRDHP_20500, partial [Ktedonobacterales bacterium]
STTDANGNYTGTIVAQGDNAQGQLEQAGVGLYQLETFDTVFTGTFMVASAGQVTYYFSTDDGFFMGIGNGATRVSGSANNVPGTTLFQGFPVMGGNNNCCSGTVTVNFPTAGTYPYEVDYFECCGDGLGITMTTTNASGVSTAVAPTGSLTLRDRLKSYAAGLDRAAARAWSLRVMRRSMRRVMPA